MWKNHLKIGLRNLFRNKLITSINIIGLSTGLAVCLLVLLFLKHEFSYDKWLSEKDQIHRLYRQWEGGGASLFTPTPLAPAIEAEVPEIISATRVGANFDMLLSRGKEYYTVPEMNSIDSNFLETFPLKLKYGSAFDALKKENNVLLSAKLAAQIFGDVDPVGQTLLLENSMPIEVGAVLAEFPQASHLKADLFVFEDYYQSSWTGASGYTYIRIHPATNPVTVQDKIGKIYSRELEKMLLADGREFQREKYGNWQLQALPDIHLNSHQFQEAYQNRGSYRQLKIIGLLGLMVLALALINYINLATARYVKRGTEVGVRKVIGANSKQLIHQFMSEAGINIMISIFVAFVLVQMAIPYFNEVVQRPLSIWELADLKGGFLILGLVTLASLLSGLFPALFFSKINPVQSIKNQLAKGKKSIAFRNGLVIFQFALSAGLMLYVSTIWQQVHYMQTKELGYADEQIAVFRINQSETIPRYQQNRQQLLALPGVNAATQISRAPGDFIPNYSMLIEGQEETASVNILFGDYEWLNTFQVPITNGRFFSKDFGTDSTRSVVVNQAFVKAYGIEDPIGHQVKFVRDAEYAQIIGVLENFHYQGMENNIEPVILSARMDKTWMGRVAVNIDAQNPSKSIAAISKFWQEIEPGFPVTYQFVDQKYAALYEQYVRFGKSLLFTSIACIIIALLGLFGLSVFVTQQRTKEIGIRKVLGASISNILGLLSKDILRLVILAIIIGAPIAGYFANQWLANFAYHIQLSWWMIVAVSLGSIGIAWLTISVQTIKIATTNPVNSLKNE